MAASSVVVWAQSSAGLWVEPRDETKVGTRVERLAASRVDLRAEMMVVLLGHKLAASKVGG